jgi:regulator of replication initiation timing
MTNIFKSLTKESEFDRAFRHMSQIQNARLEMRRRRLTRAIEENKRLKLEKEKLQKEILNKIETKLKELKDSDEFQNAPQK